MLKKFLSFLGGGDKPDDRVRPEHPSFRSLPYKEHDPYKPYLLTIDLTRSCTQACAHCITSAAPKRKETLDEETVLMAIRDAGRAGFSDVCFYGGEPLTRRELLLKGVQETWRFGMTPQVMTNGYWGVTARYRDKVFAEVRAAAEEVGHSTGSRNLIFMISTDRFHTGSSHESIARIMTGWLHDSNDTPINVALSVGGANQDEINQEGTALFDAFLDSDSGYYLYGPINHAMGQRVYYAEIDGPSIEVSSSTSVAKTLRSLVKAGVLSKDKANGFKHAPNMHELDMLLFINGYCAIERKDGFTRYRAMSPKQSYYKTYDFLHEGRLSTEELDDNALKGSARAYDHEILDNLILGIDGRFYLQPAQLVNGISPLGRTVRGSIRHANRSPVAKVILDADVLSVQSMVARVHGRDSALLREFNHLVRQGFSSEAMWLGLKDVEVQRGFVV